MLGEERHAQALRHPVHGRPRRRGNALRGVDKRLEETALVEHHVVGDAYLHRGGGWGRGPGEMGGERRVNSPLDRSAESDVLLFTLGYTLIHYITTLAATVYLQHGSI